jgi:thiamine biosynthesis protein ThiS
MVERMNTSAETIRITVNGDERDFIAGSTVADLLTALKLNPQLVVVEHNREILDRRNLASVAVQRGDVFELVHFVGGG